MTDQPAEQREIIRVAEQFRRALDRHDAEAMNRLVEAYHSIHNRLQDKIALLIDAIGVEEPTQGELVRMTRYKALISQVEDELKGYQAITRNEIEQAGKFGIAQAGRDAQRMVRAYGITGGFNRLPTSVIYQVLGFLQPDSPLWKRLEQLAPQTAKSVADKIVEGIGLGYNPRKIADEIADALGGGLTDALRMTRTVQIWSYREASRANYIMNSDVVTGWTWFAHLDDRVCEACAAMHGTVHDLDETLDGHYNCRCTPIPLVADFDSPVTQTGEEWFNELSEDKQRELLGPGKYDAWKGGKFEFSQLATKREDEVYGLMTTVAALKDLIGEEG